MLGEDRIASESGCYVLRAAPSEIDAARFEQLVRRAKAELATDPATAANELADALTMWRGSPLPHLSEEPPIALVDAGGSGVISTGPGRQSDLVRARRRGRIALDLPGLATVRSEGKGRTELLSRPE